MNKTKIEWTDFTWNPVTGCYHGCGYCYARKVASRFYPGSVKFNPYLWTERLTEPKKVKKPSMIFVSSMGDLFGAWVPAEWIELVIDIVKGCPHHTFQFLTKNPRRLKDFNPWPPNCWVGTTITNQDDMDERGFWLIKVDAPVRFISNEPLLGPIDLGPINWNFDWAIIGAMTGPGAVKSKPEWAQNLLEQYQSAGIPVFIKNNLKGLVGCGLKDAPQEWPIIKQVGC